MELWRPGLYGFLKQKREKNEIKITYCVSNNYLSLFINNGMLNGSFYTMGVILTRNKIEHCSFVNEKTNFFHSFWKIWMDMDMDSFYTMTSNYRLAMTTKRQKWLAKMEQSRGARYVNCNRPVDRVSVLPIPVYHPSPSPPRNKPKKKNSGHPWNSFVISMQLT